MVGFLKPFFENEYVSGSFPILGVSLRSVFNMSRALPLKNSGIRIDEVSTMKG